MILKKLGNLWQRGVKRIIKSQQKKNTKLIKSLLAKPAAKTRRPSAVQSTRRKTPAPLPQTPPGAVTHAPGKWLKFSQATSVLESGSAGHRMNYWLYLPDNTVASRVPLVVMLHGCGQTATEFAQSTRMNLLAEKKGFAVLYPQRPAARDPSRCWHWYKRIVQQGGGEATDIAGIIETVTEKYALDKSRIYIAGISAGAAMANIIALNHPHLIAAVGMHSGAVFGVANSAMEGYAVMQRGASLLAKNAVRDMTAPAAKFPAMPAILIHGDKDSVVRPINLLQLSEQFRELNHLSEAGDKPLSIAVIEKPGGPRSGNAYNAHEYYVGNKLMLKVCEIFQLDHAWSGGDPHMRFSEGKGPDASKLMWDFFAKHKRASAASRIRSTSAVKTAS